MNSSGIKRGLAATAISALAVTGLPALATTANAEPGDNFTVTYTGPALNGGDQGAVVVLRAEDGEITPALLELTSTSSGAIGSEDNADQNAQIVDRSIADDPANSNFDLITLNIKVTTSADGQTATFRVFENDDPTDTDLDAGEARQTVSITTAGELADIVVTPASQSAPQGIESGPYTVELKDAAGRTTQLDAGEQIVITHDPDVTTNESGNTITADEIERGTDTFRATGTTVGNEEIDLTSTTLPVETATAILNVTQAANITANEVNIVTAADSWNGFGDGVNGGITVVRVDQNIIRIDFDSNDPNATVTLNLDGTGDVTFGGRNTSTVSTVLDNDGKGSVTIQVDPGTIQEGDELDITGSFDQTLEFDRAEASDIESPDRVFSAVDGSVDITVTVVDQFGDAISGGFVEADRQGPNADATPQRKAVGPDGTVTFTFTDANASNGQVENVLFEYFADQFTNTPTAFGNTEIKYTTDGQGSNYVVSLDGENTEGANYDASDVTIDSLTDTVANNPDVEDESAELTLTNGEAGAQVTVSVDNGALILEPGETRLSQGSASIADTVTGGGNLPAGYRIIGTNSGVVTVTVSSANRTETAQMVVAAQDDPSTARNVTVSGPAEVPFGTDQIQYIAVITDAFGNPVEGVTVGQLNIQVTGPAEFQDSDAVTDENGQLRLNVNVDEGAEGVVTIRVQGLPAGTQFGAEEDQLTAASNNDDAEGLSESSDVATASTTVNAPAVEKVNAALTLKGGDNGAADDSLFANAINKTEGAVVKLFRKRADGTWKFLQKGIMNAEGNHRFEDVNDRNGNKVTRYKAIVKATDETFRGVGKKKVR